MFVGILSATIGLFWFGGPSLALAQADTTGPTISSVAITSDPDDDDSAYADWYDDGVYGIGDGVEVTVTFNENVTVTGSPQLEITIGTNAEDAAYKSTTDSKVVFSYTVASGDNDTNGIAIIANKLTLNGGGIKDAAENPADLAHSALSAQSGHKVDGIRPTITTAPYLVDSSIGTGGVYIIGEKLSARVGFSEEVIAIGAQPVPSLGIDVGGTTRYADFSPIPADDWRDVTLIFTYTVAKGDLDGVAVAANSVGLNGGAIRDAAGNDAVLTHSAVAAEDGETTKTYTVTVTRAATPSKDATLKWLALSGIDIGGGLGDGAYAQIRTSFTASVYYSVSQTTVTPTPNHSAASYVIKLGGVTDADGVITLSVGSNVITIEVTAEDGQATKTYTATVTRATQSAPTTGELPTDDPRVNFRTPIYTHDFVALAFNTPRNRGITGDVIQRYEHDGDSFVSAGDDGRFVNTLDDDLGGSSTAWSYTEAEPGTLYKWVVKLVNSQNATVIETSLTVRTPPEPGSTTLSSDATLSDLTLSGIDFEATDRAFIAPGFHGTVVSYVGRVANSVTETTATPTVNHSGASYVIKLGGVTDADGTVSLAVGGNVITIEVTAEDGVTTRTYTVTVTRVSSSASTDATLRRLVLSGMDFGTFAPGTTSYTAQVANSVTETTVSDFVSHLEASSVVKLGGVTDTDRRISLAVGSNVITVEVTAEDLVTTKTYTVTVTRAASPSTDAALKALTLSGVDYGTFAPGTTSYAAEVANSVLETGVTPAVNHSEASYVIKLGGVIRGLNRVAARVPLSVGSNVITIEVTAEDDSTTQTYTVTVTRAAPPSTDATLRGLTLSVVDFGTFDSTTTSYTAQIANSVTQTTVTQTVNDSGASYVIKLGGVTDADGTVSLAVGSNVITIEVTAEDGLTTRTYTVTVTRAAPPSTDATLRGLTLSVVDFGTFDSTTTSYTAQVANSVTQTTVTQTINHSGASYVIMLSGVTDADGTVSLAVGSNVIAIEVTAEDGLTTRTYTVTVTRAAPPSTDATLSALALNGIDFGAFASGTTSYTAQVANSVTQTTVSPTANDSGASYVITLGGVTDADGVVLLRVGSNVITVEGDG